MLNPEQTIHTVALRCQIQLEVTRRKYTAEDQERLLDLFGEPSRWGQTLRSLLWTHANLVVPSFTGKHAGGSSRALHIRFQCSCHQVFRRAWRRRSSGLCAIQRHGFLCSPEGGLQVAPISWDKEARFKLPVKVWREMMESYYPNSAWLCLHKDAFDRLYQYKVRHGIPTWEEALESIIPVRRDGDLMNLAAVEQIAKAVLYEGYMLYPYRPSSVKNQQRWNFGVLCPRSYSEAQKGSEAWTMQTECLVEGSSTTGTRSAGSVSAIGRPRRRGTQNAVSDLPASDTCPEFRLVERLALNGRVYQPWQEAIEREVILPVYKWKRWLQAGLLIFSFPAEKQFEYLRDDDGTDVGVIVRERSDRFAARSRSWSERVGDGIFKISVRDSQYALPFEVGSSSRDDALLRSWSLPTPFSACKMANSSRCSLLPNTSRTCRDLQEYWNLAGAGRRRRAVRHHAVLANHSLRLSPDRSGKRRQICSMEPRLTKSSRSAS